MLKKSCSNKIIDICCRIISTDGEVTLEERIWMHKLCEENEEAKELAGNILEWKMLFKTNENTNKKYYYVLVDSNGCFYSTSGITAYAITKT